MRKPITQASFHDSVGGWSFEEFKKRFEGQMTIEEIEYFAKELGIKKAPTKQTKFEEVKPEPTKD